MCSTVFFFIFSEQDVPYIGYMNFSKPGILLKDPEMIKAVLTTDFNSFNENEFKVRIPNYTRRPRVGKEEDN